MVQLQAMSTLQRRTILVLGLASILLANVATAEGPSMFSLQPRIPPRSTTDFAPANISMSGIDGSTLRTIYPGGPGWEFAMQGGTGSVPFLSLRPKPGDPFFAARTPSGDFHTYSHLLAAFGLQKFSFRVRSWRRLGPGPSVHAGTFSVFRDSIELPTGAVAGLGFSATMYRLGARFEPIYRQQRPVSINVLVRVRFGGNSVRTTWW